MLYAVTFWHYLKIKRNHFNSIFCINSIFDNIDLLRNKLYFTEVEIMENTNSEKLTRVKRTDYSRLHNRNYTSRYRNKDDEEKTYKKKIFILQLSICIGLFTGALLIRAIDIPFTEDLRQKFKAVISENVAIEEIYDIVIQKLEDFNIKINSNSETVESSPDSSLEEDEDLKKNSEIPKLTPSTEK